VNLGFCRSAGKGEGELSLLRRIREVLLADRLAANWAKVRA
jgi:hypothetical protein